VVVIAIALGDLALLVLCLARGAPLLCCGLVPTSSGRGALAGTRWGHFNYNGKKARRLAGEEKLQEDRRHKSK
jgi:hypothetical protein